MIHIVKHLKNKTELLVTEDFQEAVNANVNQPDTWVDTIDADIEDIEKYPDYPDVLTF
jgi:hypothetical protein